MDFSREQAVLIASSGRATSISLRGDLMGWVILIVELSSVDGRKRVLDRSAEREISCVGELLGDVIVDVLFR